jgi:ABC-type polysaccharide/polyol phosphate export permease
MTVLRLLWRHRALVDVLVRRELTARYRSSLLGFFWSLLNPLLLLTVYAVVFTLIFQPRFPGGDPYPLFLFSGLLPWLFFSGAAIDSSVTLVDNGPLLAKVMCPPEIFPAITVLSHLVHHVLALPVLLAALVVSAMAGWYPFPWTFVLLPVALVPWVLLAGGTSFAVSALAVHFRHLRDLLGGLRRSASVCSRGGRGRGSSTATATPSWRPCERIDSVRRRAQGVSLARAEAGG